MTRLDYFIEISRATDATTLHGLTPQAVLDSYLTEADLDAVANAIHRRFSTLNHETLKHQKPRFK